MTVLDNRFFHGSIELYTKVFGTVFNNIKVLRDSGQIIPVPIMYATGQKHNIIDQQKPDKNISRFKATYPRMSFEMTNVSRDITRVKNKQHRITDFDRVDPKSTVKAQYNRVPFNFEYRLDIKTKYLKDMWQIIEQILVSFDPSLQVVVKDNPDIGGESGITITLNGNSLTDDIEGMVETERQIDVSMNFILEGYLYRRTDDVGLINKVIIEYRDIDNEDLFDTQVIEG